MTVLLPEEQGLFWSCSLSIQQLSCLEYHQYIPYIPLRTGPCTPHSPHLCACYLSVLSSFSFIQDLEKGFPSLCMLFTSSFLLFIHSILGKRLPVFLQAKQLQVSPGTSSKGCCVCFNARHKLCDCTPENWMKLLYYCVLLHRCGPFFSLVNQLRENLNWCLTDLHSQHGVCCCMFLNLSVSFYYTSGPLLEQRLLHS